MSPIAPHSCPLLFFSLPCSSRHRRGWEPHLCRSNNSCSKTTMDSIWTRETRALSRYDFPCISREKNWSRTMKKLQKRPHLPYEKYTIFWSRRRTFPLLSLSDSDGSRHIFSARLSFMNNVWVLPRYFHVLLARDRCIEHIAWIRECQQAPFAMRSFHENNSWWITTRWLFIAQVNGWIDFRNDLNCHLIDSLSSPTAGTEEMRKNYQTSITSPIIISIMDHGPYNNIPKIVIGFSTYPILIKKHI